MWYLRNKNTPRETRGTILIYAMVLANFAIILAYVIFLKSETLVEDARYTKMSNKWLKNIEEKANAAIDYDLMLNKNGSGFTDTRTCPTLSMSGTAAGSTYSESLATVAFFDGTNIVCSGSSVVYPGEAANVRYASGYLTFSGVNFRGSTVPLVGTSSLTGTLSESDLTRVSFTLGSMSAIDANFNSDDYRPYSSGVLVYPGAYVDDDDLARKFAYGYIRNDSGWRNVFWNTPNMLRTIRKNTNNTGSSAVFPDASSTGYLLLDSDNTYSLKIVEFDTGMYTQTKELKILSTTGVTSASSGIGYLQSNLTLGSGVINRMVFDLKNRNYAIFLNFTGTGADFLKYKISFVNQSGSLIYTVPLDDSDPLLIRYTGNDLIIDDENHYLSKENEIVQPKR